MWKGILPLLAAVTLSAGCLIKETTQTLYLDPDGPVTWTVMEKDVRSDGRTHPERLQEEREFLSLASSDDHPVARALASLAPRSVSSVLTRRERPYAIFTSARFDRADALVQHLLEGLGIPGHVELEIGERSRLRVTLRPQDLHESDGQELENDLLDLLEDRKNYRIVLTEGKFVEAVGFEIVEDRSAAVLAEIDDEEIERNGGTLELSLTWTTVEE